AMTERAAQALALEGADPRRIRVCPPGVDLERFNPRARAPEPGLVLSPGRLVWEKGHQELIRALAVGARRGDPPVRALIVGRGAERERLAAYARELGVADRVELREFVPYDEMPALYARAERLYLGSIPTWSWEEQFGMVLAEAMAAGVPVVTTGSGAIR